MSKHLRQLYILVLKEQYICNRTEIGHDVIKIDLFKDVSSSFFLNGYRSERMIYLRYTNQYTGGFENESY